MPSHEQGPDLLTAIEFKGDRQMVLDDNGKTFVATIEWGYPGAFDWRLWDAQGRHLNCDDGRTNWGLLEPGSKSYPAVLLKQIGLAAGIMLLPIAFVWLLIYVTICIVVYDRDHSKWRCPQCGYDLRGLDKPGCPECGWSRE
ncbi:MAG: hypothetical protein KJZ69_19550 [Phycisphaerales bacterium]|nr:hypothetical protein [Phycisphaerales bacterium]